MSKSVLDKLPSVSELLDSEPLRPIVKRLSRNVVVMRVRALMDDLRNDVKTSSAGGGFPDVNLLAQRIARRILQAEDARPRTTINASGILLHPSAPPPLTDEAVEAVWCSLRGDVILADDEECEGAAGEARAVASLLVDLAGAEAALVVASRGAALMLACAATAGARALLVSRAHLVETDDGCRIADLVVAAGARLREVGAANKTRLADYEAAVGQDTAGVIVADRADFSPGGAPRQPPVEELVAFARRQRFPLIHHLDLALLRDMDAAGLEGIPVVAKCVAAGADLVVFGGDRLIGGPRCGIVAGDRALVREARRHALYAALRADRPTLAALAATLMLHRDDAAARQSLPIAQLIAASVENLKNRAERLAPQMAQSAAIAAAEALAGHAYLTPARLPSERLDSWQVALTGADADANALAAALRRGSPAVIPRVEGPRVLLDLRGVPPRQDENLLAALAAVHRGP